MQDPDEVIAHVKRGQVIPRHFDLPTKDGPPVSPVAPISGLLVGLMGVGLAVVALCRAEARDNRNALEVETLQAMNLELLERVFDLEERSGKPTLLPASMPRVGGVR